MRQISVRRNQIKNFHRTESLQYALKKTQICANLDPKVSSMMIGAFHNPFFHTRSLCVSKQCNLAYISRRLSARRDKKRLQQTPALSSRPYRRISLQNITISIDEHGNPQAVSVYRVANAPLSFPRQLEKSHNRTNQVVSTPHSDKYEETAKANVPRARKKTDEEGALSNNDYVVEY